MFNPGSRAGNIGALRRQLAAIPSGNVVPPDLLPRFEGYTPYLVTMNSVNYDYFGENINIFANYANSGALTNTDFTGGTIKTIADVTGRGFLGGVCGPRIISSNVNTFYITIDGVMYTIPGSTGSGRNFIGSVETYSPNTSSINLPAFISDQGSQGGSNDKKWGSVPPRSVMLTTNQAMSQGRPVSYFAKSLKIEILLANSLDNSGTYYDRACLALYRLI